MCQTPFKNKLLTMNEEWIYLVKRYTEAGARSKFEDICATLLKKKFPTEFVKTVKIKVGDGGVDIFIGDIENKPIQIFQCKFFVNGIAESQKKQIRESFDTAINSENFRCSKWTLCIPEKLTLDNHKWWSGWIKRKTKEYDLPNNFIDLIDGADLVDSLKEFELYNSIFDEDIKNNIDEIKKSLEKPLPDLERELLSASGYIENLKNYFSKNKDTHIHRKETDEIVNWVESELPGKDCLERILVLKGKKGVGKTTILKDAYSALVNESDYSVLAIKCDQCYDSNLPDLLKQVFNNISSINELQLIVKNAGKKFIVFLDQLDALSQTLSSDRRSLLTYVKLIRELNTFENIRIIMSSRTFDLEYDSDLRVFNNTQVIKHVQVSNLSKDEVKGVLKTLNVVTKSKIILEMLTVPYNLELLTKIPNMAALLKREARLPLAKLYSEIWKQVLTKKDLQIIDCLDLIVNRMYELHPNLINILYLEEFQDEIDFLISQDILFKNDDKLAFFHQSFYEYYLAKWFAETNRDLLEYIFDEDQNLYIRSLLKTYIEYLRESNHKKYIDLYKQVLDNEQVRFHIKYLFIVELGIINIPSKKENNLVLDIISSKYGDLFMETLNSKGWITFFINNNLLKGNENKVQQILYKNLNHNPLLVLNYLEQIELQDREDVFKNFIPHIQDWKTEYLDYFNKYYSYDENLQLWYFEILKKIAPFNLPFVFEKLKPAILAEKQKNERIRFDYRFDRIIEFLHEQNPKELALFLLNIQLDILESTAYEYFIHNKYESPLKSSYHYNNAFFYKDSREEKSIDYYIIKYYKHCKRVELKEFYEAYKHTNFVTLLTTLVKLLRDRSNEFAEEIFDLLKIVESKNGFKGTDDFFQLNLRKLISNSILLFNKQQYGEVKRLILNIEHPYELHKYSDQGKRKYWLVIGRKKYLFIKALPIQILENDLELKSEYQMLHRRFGELDHLKALDRGGSRWGSSSTPLSNPNYEKFSYKAWINSMVKVNEDFKSEDFFKGGILELARDFESCVEKRPHHYYDLIQSLFKEKKVSRKYISHGISGLITAKFDSALILGLILKEIKLHSDKSSAWSTVRHTNYLIDTNQVTEEVVNFLVSTAKSNVYANDVLNSEDPTFDFINTTRGAATDNLIHLYKYKQYEEIIFSTVEFLVDPKNKSSNTILCGIMSNLAYLNHLDALRSFEIFKKLTMLKNPLVLNHSFNTAQYFNNSFHNEMKFYFDEMLKHEELLKHSYFFVTSWLWDEIDDYEMYCDFLEKGINAIKCSLKVAEDFLIKDDNINSKALKIIKDSLGREDDISQELSGLVLRKFKPVHFEGLYDFIKEYIVSIHFKKDPRYLFMFLIECVSLYPLKCLELANDMSLPEDVDQNKTAYLRDEPLTLILSIYSKLRLDTYKHRNEQSVALDVFDKMLAFPSIRNKALEAMDNVLN